MKQNITENFIKNCFVLSKNKNFQNKSNVEESEKKFIDKKTPNTIEYGEQAIKC